MRGDGEEWGGGRRNGGKGSKGGSRGRGTGSIKSKGSSLVPRPSLSLSFEVTILEAGKKEFA